MHGPFAATMLSIALAAAPSVPGKAGEVAQAIEVANGDDAAAALDAIDALSLTHDPQAFRTLALLVAHEDPARKRHAQEGLARMPIAESTLITLLDEDDNLIVKKAAAWSLGILRSEPAVPVLLEQLKSHDGELRAKSATALGRIGHEGAMEPLLVMANRDKSPEARRAATRALEEMSDPEVHGRLPPLAPMLSALKAPDAVTRKDAALKLATRGNRRSVGPLLEQVKAETDLEARRAMIEALGEIGDPIAVPFLLSHLDDAAAPAAERYSVMASLAVLKDPRAVPKLITVARKDNDTTARRFAVRALGYMTTSEAREALVAALVDRSPPVRIEALRALENQQARGQTEAILARLGDPEPTVRSEAARILGFWEITQASPKLVELMKKDDTRLVRQAAVVALGRAGDRAALDALAQLVSDEGKKKASERDGYLIEQASEAIIELQKRLPEGP